MEPKQKLQSTNMPNQQVICFIDPQRFSTLLGHDKSVRIGFRHNRSFLNNSRLLVYVDEEGKCKINSFCLEDASSAYIILVPDTFEFTYEPQCEFTVLYHSLTPIEKVNGLKHLKHYRGSKKSIEESSTVYSEIAGYLTDEKGSPDHSNPQVFDSVWRQLSSEFIKGETDNLCTRILMGYELAITTLPNCLMQFSKEFSEFKEAVGQSYDSGNTQHKSAFDKLKSQLSRI